MGYAIGIDIGTANTRVAVYRDGQVEIIPDKDGQRCMPSYVAFTEKCRLFGNAAKAHADSDPKNTVYGVKRVLGQRLEQWHVDRHARISPNDVSLEPPGRMAITVGYKKRPRRLLPVQVFAMLLMQAAANAVAYLGESVQDVVISVPARFDRLQRLDVYDAAKLAGLNLMYIGSAIESIALYYAFLRPQMTTRLDGEQVCTILGHGAGSFNAGLVSIKNGAIKLLSAQSDTDLGGECLIDCLQDHFAAEIKRKWNWNINTDLIARRRLRVACEAAMRELSSTVSTHILVRELHDGQDFSGNLSREMLEQLCQYVFRGTLKTIDRVFNNQTLHETIGLDTSSMREVQDKPSAKKGRERPASKFGFIIKSSNKNRRVKSTMKDRQNKSYHRCGGKAPCQRHCHGGRLLTHSQASTNLDHSPQLH